jgi:uncharacterized membrane protein YdjX (TVP38/TMEM64 family)
VSSRRRVAALAAVLGLLAATGLLLVTQGGVTPGSARAWADRELRDPVAELGVLGPLLFVVAGACATALLFPGPITIATSGLLFGTAVGFPVALGAVLAGATLAFLLARTWAHDAVEELAGPRVAALRAWIGRRGFLAVLYARILPGMPYNLVNYAAGLAPVRLPAFAAATALGAAPRTFAYTALGGSLGDLRSPEALAAVGVLAAMALAGAGLALRERRRSRAARAALRPPGSAAATSSPDARSAGPR